MDDEHIECSVERGSGNVFADLDLPDADPPADGRAVGLVDDIIRQRRTTQAETASALGLSRPDLSHLLRATFASIRWRTFFRFLMALGCDVDIVIRPSDPDTAGNLRIVAPELD